MKTKCFDKPSIRFVVIAAFHLYPFAMAQESDPLSKTSARVAKWDEYEWVHSISLGEDDADTERVTLRLLEPEPITGEGQGGFDTNDETTVTTYEANTPSHGFVFTSDGDLYIDNLYAGRFTRKDALVFGSGRLWSNGVPCTMKPMTALQLKSLFSDGGGVFEADGTRLVHRSEWPIYLKPGGAGGSVDPTGGAFMFSDGMTVIRVEQGRLIVNGIDFGSIMSNQTIKVCDGVVSVDQVLRAPLAISRISKAEKSHEEAKPGTPE